MGSLYKGKNRYRTFLKGGEIISGKIAKIDGVVGILGTGAIGRKFGDRFSDLDLIVYAHKDSIKSIRSLVSIGWIGFKGVDYDILVESYERARDAAVPSRYWSQLRRWDHQNSQILYDRKNSMKRLLKEKLIYQDSEQKRLLKRYQMAVHEHLVFFPELWAERGKLYNIKDTLIRGIENIILWVYAKNKVFEPYIPKWLFYHFEMRSIPEYVYLDRLVEIYAKPIKTISVAMRTRDNLIDLCDKIGLTWDIYSMAEAKKRTISNWERLPEKSKKLLDW